MSWKIPNKQVASYPIQAKVFDSALKDLVLARMGTGVINGCSVSVSSAMTLTVATGNVMFGGSLPVAVATGSVTLAANANPSLGRVDIVQVTNAGIKGVVAGELSVEPVEPDLADNAVKLCAVYVPPSTTTLTDLMVSDRRCEVVRPYSVYEYAVATGQYTGAEEDFLESLRGAQGNPGPAQNIQALDVGEAIPTTLPLDTLILRLVS